MKDSILISSGFKRSTKMKDSIDTVFNCSKFPSAFQIPNVQVQCRIKITAIVAIDEIDGKTNKWCVM